ncbi:MAG: hypothetical protein HOQ02_10380 [Lysobacter sp.]|nr:hypothetical protein [Lysobacter sp.]
MNEDASIDRIQTPRRMVFDWFGTAGREPVAGEYMRAMPSRRTYLVLSVRALRVRVTRGETLRQSLEIVPWPEEPPQGVRVHRFHWNQRTRRPARRLQRET